MIIEIIPSITGIPIYRGVYDQYEFIGMMNKCYDPKYRYKTNYCVVNAGGYENAIVFDGDSKGKY